MSNDSISTSSIPEQELLLSWYSLSLPGVLPTNRTSGKSYPVEIAFNASHVSDSFPVAQLVEFILRESGASIYLPLGGAASGTPFTLPCEGRVRLDLHCQGCVDCILSKDRSFATDAAGIFRADSATKNLIRVYEDTLVALEANPHVTCVPYTHGAQVWPQGDVDHNPSWVRCSNPYAKLDPTGVKSAVVFGNMTSAKHQQLDVICCVERNTKAAIANPMAGCEHTYPELPDRSTEALDINVRKVRCHCSTDVDRFCAANETIYMAKHCLYVFCPLPGESRDDFLSYMSTVKKSIRAFQGPGPKNLVTIVPFAN